ncbi:MAG: 50S ribosomal protein L21e [Candidatus Aenigmatarchaeota archaeon]
MVKKSRGFRSRTRKKLRQKARPVITKFLQDIKIGEKVIILQDPYSQKGMPHPRFKGKVGKIIERRGKSYIVEIIDGNKVKKIISRPEHLRLVK